MFCPACGVENNGVNFCHACQTNLAIVAKLIAREDARARRSRIFSRTGLVSIIISEGFAWTLAALALFFMALSSASQSTDPNATSASFQAAGLHGFHRNEKAQKGLDE